MNQVKRSKLPVIGAPFGGGFYTGILNIDGVPHALVTAPKAQGQGPDQVWSPDYKLIKNCRSFFDGLANTKAIAKAGLALGKWAVGLRIDGQRDWALPARDQLELQYRNLKPTTAENYMRCGDNPSTGTWPYTEKLPAQTKAKLFKQGGAEAFDDVWYWSSTHYSANYAWCQLFHNGLQNTFNKTSNYRVRAVRTVRIIN